MEVGVQRSFVPREEFLGRPFIHDMRNFSLDMLFFLSPLPTYIFIGADFIIPPPYQCPFQRPLMVGLNQFNKAFVPRTSYMEQEQLSTNGQTIQLF